MCSRARSSAPRALNIIILCLNSLTTLIYLTTRSSSPIYYVALAAACFYTHLIFHFFFYIFLPLSTLFHFLKMIRSRSFIHILSQNTNQIASHSRFNSFTLHLAISRSPPFLLSMPYNLTIEWFNQPLIPSFSPLLT